MGREAAEEVARFMESRGALDEHLGEQLLLPAALLASAHITHSRVTKRFVSVWVPVEPEGTVGVSLA